MLVLIFAYSVYLNLETIITNKKLDNWEIKCNDLSCECLMKFNKFWYFTLFHITCL